MPPLRELPRDPGLEFSPEPERGLRVQLADPRLAEAEYRADLLHRELFVVIQRDQLLLPLRQKVDRLGEHLPEVPEEVILESVVFGGLGQDPLDAGAGPAVLAP